ncbi:MAG TPA: 2-isopropylmalate synthase, partial [Rhodospirillales bacterium]|nr:2-isopropylmalate synthase [Rhodospirillales bacterium]
YANGNKYLGEWKNGKYHGLGTFTVADGTVKEGIWENNNLKRPWWKFW